MSPKLPSLKANGPVKGSGPGGQLLIDDIRSKLDELRGDVNETAETAKPILISAAVAGTVIVVLAAFFLGRKRGRRKSTWVEIRRQ